MIARDMMTENLATVSISSTVAEAAEILQTLSIRHLPVLENGSLVGILSDRDLKTVYLANLSEGETQSMATRLESPVTTIMTPDPVKVHPEASVSELIGPMLEHKVGALPVVDHVSGDLLGIVSYVDVLRAVQESL